MNKRDFLKAAGIGVLAATASGAVFGVSVPSTRESVEHVFERLAGIEVTIFDMREGTQRTIFVTSDKPIPVPEAKRPFSVVFTEHDDESVGMTLLEQVDGHWVEVDVSYAGHVSTQVLTDRGVVFRIIAHSA